MRIVKGSVCFVCDGPHVLLLHRNHDPFMGKWDGLSGLAEFGESPIETAAREVSEEAGLCVGGCYHRGHLLLYNVDTPQVVVADLIVATEYVGTLRGSEEGLPQWVPVADLPAIDLIGFVHVTLPRVLVPESFLIGTIHHRSNGDAVRYTLSHHRVTHTETLIL